MAPATASAGAARGGRARSLAPVRLVVLTTVLPLLPANLPLFAPAPWKEPRCAATRVALQQARGGEPRALPPLSLPVMGAKARLRRRITESAIVELEHAASSAALRVGIAELRGRWRFQVPESGGSREWLSRHGVRWGMKLESAPELEISAAGEGVYRMSLRFGMQTDQVTKRSLLAVAGGNLVQEKPQSLHSGNLRLTLPWLMRPRTFQVTYLDEDLVIYRDAQGHADVMWRAGRRDVQRGNAQATVQAPKKPAPPAQPEPEPEAVASQAPAAMAARLSSDVADLTSVLEEQRLQAAQDGEEHQQLTAKASELERSLAAAGMEVKASAAQLRAAEALWARASEEGAAQLEARAARARELEELKAKAAAMEEEAAAQRAAAALAQGRQISLAAQVEHLAREARRADRESREATKLALSNARVEQRAAGQEQRKAQKAEASLERELQRLSSEVERRRAAAEAEGTREAVLKDRLEGQRRESIQQEPRVTEAAAKEQALAEELEAVRARLEELEQRREIGLSFAAQVREEMGKVAQGAREARRAAQTLQGKRGWAWKRR